LKRWVAGQPFQDNVATVVNIATAALLITGVLDAAENTHILAMLSMAEQGQSIGQSEIAGQMVESQIKVLFSYFGVFVLSFALPQRTIIERLTVFVFRWLELPVSVAILVLPLELARPLFIFRAVFFFAGLWATAWIIAHRARPRRRECCVAAFHTPCRHRRPGLNASHSAWRRQHADSAA
jgi:hypothetical protein